MNRSGETIFYEKETVKRPTYPTPSAEVRGEGKYQWSYFTPSTSTSTSKAKMESKNDLELMKKLEAYQAQTAQLQQEVEALKSNRAVPPPPPPVQQPPAVPNVISSAYLNSLARAKTTPSPQVDPVPMPTGPTRAFYSPPPAIPKYVPSATASTAKKKHSKSRSPSPSSSSSSSSSHHEGEKHRNTEPLKKLLKSAFFQKLMKQDWKKILGEVMKHCSN